MNPDLPEIRRRLLLCLHQAWPFRMLSWFLERSVLKVQGFGRFETRDPAQHEEIAKHAPKVPSGVHARAYIEDSERTENSLATRVDAAIHAIALLDRTAMEDEQVQRYLVRKYEHPISPGKLLFYHEYYPVSESTREPGQMNLHGHIYNNGLPPALVGGGRHVNMSVEVTGYAPQLLSELLRTIEWGPQ